MRDKYLSVVIAVSGKEKYSVVVLEHVLSSVAVMHVPIYDENSL